MTNHVHCKGQPVTISEHDGAVIVRVDLPGVRPEDVTIDATDRLLIICGECGDGKSEETFGRFTRTFALPVRVDGHAAIAIMSNGVLTVRIPRRGEQSNDTFAA